MNFKSFIESVYDDTDIDGIKFSQAKGLGSTPNGQNVHYMGFFVYMKPYEFLALNPFRSEDENVKKIHSLITSGSSLSSPMINAVYDPKNRSFQIYSHEGRGRMQSLAKINPRISVPVAVFPSQEGFGKLRAKHFSKVHNGVVEKPENEYDRQIGTTDDILKSTFYPDKRATDQSFYFKPAKITLGGEDFQR